MNKLATILAFSTSVTAFAHNNMSPQKFNARVREAAAKRGLSVKQVTTRGLGYGATGKEKVGYVANGNGQVKEVAVGPNRVRFLNTHLQNPSTAAGQANQTFRRETNAWTNKGGPGTYEGVNRGGLTAARGQKGAAMRFHNAGDRNDLTTVGKTGKVFHREGR